MMLLVLVLMLLVFDDSSSFSSSSSSFSSDKSSIWLVELSKSLVRILLLLFQCRLLSEYARFIRIYL